MFDKKSREERYQRLKAADQMGDDDMSLEEAYETLLSDYQELRELNEELKAIVNQYASEEYARKYTGGKVLNPIKKSHH